MKYPTCHADGCVQILTDGSPSPWFCSKTCQDRWNGTNDDLWPSRGKGMSAPELRCSTETMKRREGTKPLDFALPWMDARAR